ncbi:MAG: hypothetical protein GXO20_01515 [Thermodesulfobacteria bacterium]|nr:hypothetical protein [Thermodesulfobacteriota bacterium]
MKIHERIIQEISTPSQNLNQNPKKADFKAQLEKALRLHQTEEAPSPLTEELDRALGLAEEIMRLLEMVSQGQKEVLSSLGEKAQSLSEASKKFSGTTRYFLEELSLVAAVNAAKAQEGFI